MDHGGQFESEGTGMSHMQLGGVDLCDNLPKPQALAAQTRNLNETNTLTHTQSLSPSQNDDGGGCGLIQDTSVINRGKEGGTGRASEQDGEEDVDEVMKEDEEEEESEGSSCLVRCQSPDTPMTDSSFSETGSLLETPFPFSPGTSPEPASPIIPAVSPEITYPIRPVETSRIDVKVDSSNSNTESVFPGAAITAGPAESTTQTKTSDIRSGGPPGSTCSSERTTHTTAEQHTSSTEPPSNSMATASLSATAPLTPYLTRMPTTTGTESTSPTEPLTSNWEHILTSTPVPPCFPVPTCTTGSFSSSALLESLEHLATRGDELHLPQYLHQIAEAFVLQKDYQRALWCIQLERLYHQRVLDNLNALQEQWEIQCGRTSSNLATQHLNTLKHICQTHNRPSVTDAVSASQKALRPKTAEGGALLTCSSAPLSDDSSHSQTSCPVVPSINLAHGRNPPEMSGKAKGDPDRLLQGRVGSAGDGRESEEGIGATISVPGSEVHPSLTGEMDQSKPAELQGGDLGLPQEKEAKREEEESEVEEAAEALEMEDEGEEEEEESLKLGDSPFCPGALSVETLTSGAEVEVQHLHQEAIAEEKLHEEIQESTHLDPKAHQPQEAHMKQQEQAEEDVEEDEEEEDYEVEQADLIREAAVLDDMAKLITVEEMCPAPGLVSILKKRRVYVEEVRVSATSESRPDKPPAKRRVHFKVPDDGYEQDVGGGDSCLLLFLLCMVTVVISVGGTALYCALGDAHSSVCQDFSRNADFYMGQLQRGIAQIQHWFMPSS